MVDLHPAFSDMLKGISRVELTFPNAKSKFPVTTIKELVNTAKAVYDGEERLSGHEFQIDVWDNGKTPKKVMELAQQISAKVTAAGMERYFGQLMRDPSGLQRYCIRIRFTLDEHTFYVYRS